MPSETQFPLLRHTLPNGLRLVLQPDRSLPLVAVNLWYHVGSKNEQPGHTGLAHLFEHMLFQGSQHVGTNDHFGHLQKVGGIANGSTSKDRTNYYETLPSSYLDLALWLESDRMGFLLPALSAEKLENQRQVVANERLQRVDNQPYGRASERVFELLFPGEHPYRWPVIGYMPDIQGATLEEVAGFFATYYRPNNAVLTLAGDLDPEAALASVERYFGELPAGELPASPRPQPQPAVAVREELEDDVALPRVWVACRIPPYGQRPWYAADLLSSALGDGKASPLYQDLVYDRQIAQSVGAFVYEYELSGIFLVVATGRQGQSARELEAAIAGHLDRLAVAPPAAADLARARSRLQSSFFDQLQSLDGRADLLAQWTTYFDDPTRLYEEDRRHADLEPEELCALAQGYLAAEQRVVLAAVPRRAA